MPLLTLMWHIRNHSIGADVLFALTMLCATFLDFFYHDNNKRRFLKKGINKPIQNLHETISSIIAASLGIQRIYSSCTSLYTIHSQPLHSSDCGCSKKQSLSLICLTIDYAFISWITAIAGFRRSIYNFTRHRGK